jgi:hypothetical protein
MPNDVGNSITVTGPDDEIDRLVATCFDVRVPGGQGDNEGHEFNFRAVIPIDDSSIEALMQFPDTNVMRVHHWGTKWNAYDSEIVVRRPGYLNFEFNTAWSFPELVYRQLGRMFPTLEFDIAAIDPGAWWAVTGRVAGDDAVFDEQADCKAVFERVYKAPFETVLQPDV